MVLVLPCFNEAGLITRFLDELERVLEPTGLLFLIVAVDDASTDGTPEALLAYRFASPDFELRAIRLNLNSGHQEAIRQGIVFCHGLQPTEPFDKLAVMDCDGEDDPRALREILEGPVDEDEIVFVSRGKRRESLFFRLAYWLYKKAFRLVTGSTINFGNYSVIDAKVLAGIQGFGFFHYAAFLAKTGFKTRLFPYSRRKRLDGSSKMSLQGLVMHGFRSFVEYAEESLYFVFKSFLLVFAFAFLSCLALPFGVFDAVFRPSSWSPWFFSFLFTLVNLLVVLLGILFSGLLLLSVKKESRQNRIKFERLR